VGFDLFFFAKILTVIRFFSVYAEGRRDGAPEIITPYQL
jgi:hypothetical protein